MIMSFYGKKVKVSPFFFEKVKDKSLAKFSDREKLLKLALVAFYIENGIFYYANSEIGEV